MDLKVKDAANLRSLTRSPGCGVPPKRMRAPGSCRGATAGPSTSLTDGDQAKLWQAAHHIRSHPSDVTRSGQCEGHAVVFTGLG